MGNGERVASGGQNSETKPGSPVFDESLPSVNWYLGKIIHGNLTVNANIKTVAYLRGKGVHNYISAEGNHLGTYCLVASFDQNGLKHQLRFRVVPLSLAEGDIQEKIFRVELSLAEESRLVCSGNVSRYDSNGIILDEVDSATNGNLIGYSPEELCSSCSGIQNASHLAFYRVQNNGGIEERTKIPVSQLDSVSLGLRFDMSNQRLEGNEGGTCSWGECRAIGFDCCLENQCVLDGELRPGVTSRYPEDWAQSRREGEKKNYPHLFFLCPLNTHQKELVEKPEEAKSREQERVRSEGYRLDYLCLESQDPKEGECSASDFDSPKLCQENGDRWTYFCRVGECSLSSHQSRSFCETSGGAWKEIFPGDENGTESARNAIRERVWERCGCRGDDCTGFGLKANRDGVGKILSVECKFPEPFDTSPLQYLNVEIPARSVPHRFFKSSDGEGVDSLLELGYLAPSERVPEGERFYYLDPIEKFVPQGNAFNMNAILGQFSSDAFGALPAKTLAVESGQVYIIRTIQGIYTPCPSCTDDSWQSSFLPYPPSRKGVGLQASGYIHNRSEFQNNIHRGNYEDTIFGRACWVPPTMIPFGHKKMGNISRQRSTRLKTQSALYANGYRKDWFGFNLGAVIGSFDGVKWFAIGSGRRVTATSNKLFIAINAPFGDLAVASNLAVDVVPDLGGGETVASHDYDTELSLDHPGQNQGASCQYWHQCKVDSDCVTKLGWEYMCADVNHYRSRWPLFDIDGKEKVNREMESAGFLQILQNRLLVGEKKRCVYRGSGAICKKDVNRDLSDKKKKLFQCAPNFYCASLRSNDFNDGIVRIPQSNDPFAFGQERDVLGRPKRYIGAGEILENDIVSNLEYNFSLHTDSLEDVGICRPGKNLNPTDLTAQHSNKDNVGRTDYINQVSSCNSDALGALANNRVTTCPIFQTEEDGTEARGDYILDRIDSDLGHRQNRCGGDILWDDGSGGFVNSFAGLELDRLSAIGGIVQPSLVENACSRRAGAVCFTDLDCTPNILHSNLVDYLGESAFGNTRAEISYWSEHLVCSQAQPPPSLQSEDYYDYNPSLNRCCRPVGEELTMFTQDDDGIIDDNVDSDAGILNVGYFPYLFDPINPEGFYSRYISANSEHRSGFQPTPYPEIPMIRNNQTPKSFQWKSIADTGEKTCCGGTWVRKFADDSNDWSNSLRLQLDPLNFSCLNYQSEIYRQALDGADPDNYNKNSNKLCLSPGDGGCVQTTLGSTSGFDIVPPSNLATNVAVMDTTPTEVPTGGGNLVQTKNFAVPYMPIPYPNPTSVDPNDTNGPYNFFISTSYSALSIYFPDYIGGLQNIRQTGGQSMIYIDYYGIDGNLISSAGPLPNAGSTACALANASNARALVVNSYCLGNDPGGFQIMHVRADAASPSNWEYAGLRIVFNIPGSDAFCYDGDGAGVPDPNCPEGGETVGNGIDDFEEPGYAGAGTATAFINSNAMVGGNDLYYLTKLGRLELLGIPQIWYEPVYCNSNRHRLLEGIFDLPTENRNAFEGRGNYSAFGFLYDDIVNGRNIDDVYGASSGATDVSNTGEYVAFQDKVALPAVFSGNKFMCCLGLGKVTSDAYACCSGYAQENEDENFVCTLPAGTDLHVYFNTFVSNDGRGDKQPGGGLVEEDFIPEMGGPKNIQSVYDKLTALGEAYCENGSVRRGAAFGYYRAQPNDGFYIQHNTSETDQRFYSIVDDPRDSDENNENGYREFVQGFRWNHHIYCQ